MIRSRCDFGSMRGTAESSACVYGMLRRRVQRPGVGQLDDAAEVHHRDAIADVLHDLEIVRDEQVGQRLGLLQILSRRLTICAWIETSSALIGSSHTMNRGLTASARAIPMRWR